MLNGCINVKIAIHSSDQLSWSFNTISKASSYRLLVKVALMAINTTCQLVSDQLSSSVRSWLSELLKIEPCRSHPSYSDQRRKNVEGQANKAAIISLPDVESS